MNFDKNEETTMRYLIILLFLGAFIVGGFYTFPEKKLSLLIILGFRIPIAWKEGPKWFPIPFIFCEQKDFSLNHHTHKYKFVGKEDRIDTKNQGVVTGKGEIRWHLNPSMTGRQLKFLDQAAPTEEDVNTILEGFLHVHLHEKLIDITLDELMESAESNENFREEALKSVQEETDLEFGKDAIIVTRVNFRLNPSDAIVDSREKATAQEVITEAINETAKSYGVGADGEPTQESRMYAQTQFGNKQVDYNLQEFKFPTKLEIQVNGVEKLGDFLEGLVSEKASESLKKKLTDKGDE
jgi:hypothetical protein